MLPAVDLIKTLSFAYDGCRLFSLRLWCLASRILLQNGGIKDICY